MIDWEDPFDERSELERATDELFDQTPQGIQSNEVIDQVQASLGDGPANAGASYDLPFLPQYVTRPLWVVTETRKEVSVSLKPIW